MPNKNNNRKENNNCKLFKKSNPSKDIITNELSTNVDENECKCDNSIYVNRKRSGINIFEELLKDDY